MSAPPDRLTVDQLPLKLPQLPLESVAESRSTTCVEVSTPEPPSLPQSRVRGTEAVAYQGPPVSETDWPLGAVVSLVTVKVAVAVPPALFVAVTVLSPEAVVVLSQV